MHHSIPVILRHAPFQAKQPMSSHPKANGLSISSQSRRHRFDAHRKTNPNPLHGNLPSIKSITPSRKSPYTDVSHQPPPSQPRNQLHHPVSPLLCSPSLPSPAHPPPKKIHKEKRNQLTIPPQIRSPQNPHTQIPIHLPHNLYHIAHRQVRVPVQVCCYGSVRVEGCGLAAQLGDAAGQTDCLVGEVLEVLGGEAWG